MSIGSHRFPARFEYKDDLIDSIEFNSTPLYATVYEIQYKNIKRTIVSTVYHTKKEAIKELTEDNRKFEFTINSKDMTYRKESFNNQEYIVRSLRGKSNIFESYLSILKQTPKGAFSLCASLPIIAALISLSIIHSIDVMNIVPLGTLLFQLGFLSLLTISISAILFFVILVRGNGPEYTSINIPESSIESNVVYDYEIDFDVMQGVDEYEAVKCSIERDENGITFTSVDDIECKWFYPRQDDGLLTKEGQEFINHIDSVDNMCILTIVNNVSENDKFVCENREWRMIIN